MADSIRGFPSAKASKLAETFFDPEFGELYAQLYDLKQRGDHEAAASLMDFHGIKPPDGEGNLTGLVAELKAGVADLRSDTRTAHAWIKEYSGQPIKAVKLIEAWKSRTLALQYGVKDNPTDILHFVAEQGVRIYADQAMAAGTTDVTPDEFTAQADTVASIGSRYSPKIVFEAMERKIHFERQDAYPQKLMQSASGQFEAGGTDYVAKILSSDDPDGFTIGFDTGCCMTLGGASESCIWAGYEDPRYSFFAVYDDNGRLRAQSIMYIAEVNDKKILVIDNIEANAGTDLGRIAEVYRKALTKFAADQNLELEAIQIGVGYTAPEIIRSLPAAAVAPRTPLPDVYTDAHSQRILWPQPAEAAS